MEKENNSSDIDLFGNVCDDVVIEILGYLSVKDKIKLEGVSKQWQRCAFRTQLCITIDVYDFRHDYKTTKKLVKPIVGSDLGRVLAKQNHFQEEIRKEEFECVLKRCKYIKNVKLNCFIDDTILQLIGRHLNGLKSFLCVMHGITKDGLLKFGRNYGHKLEKLWLIIDSQDYTKIIEEFLKCCPNIKRFSVGDKYYGVNNLNEYICKDTNILPKCEKIVYSLNAESPEKDIENLRIISEKYGKIMKEFDVTVHRFYSRALEGITNCVENVPHLCLGFVISEHIDDNQKNIYNYIVKVSEKCRKLKYLKIRLIFWDEPSLPYNMFYAFAKFYSIETLNIVIRRTDEQIDCKSECIKLCSNLKHLKLYYTQISDEFFNDIDQHLPNLRSIDIFTERLLTDHALELLAKLKNLKRVCLGQWRVANRLITDVGVCQLINSCTRIELIQFSARPKITNTTIDTLKEIAMQRNRIMIEFCCFLSHASDELQFETKIDNNRLNNLPKNLKICIM